MQDANKPSQSAQKLVKLDLSIQVQVKGKWNTFCNRQIWEGRAYSNSTKRCNLCTLYKILHNMPPGPRHAQ